MRNAFKTYSFLLTFFISILVISSCATSSRFEEGQMEIKKVIVVSDSPSLDTRQYRHFVRQLPGLKSGKQQHFAYDSVLTRMSCSDLATALSNNGYLHADVRSSLYVRPKTIGMRNPECEVTYFLYPHESYILRNLNFVVDDERIDSLFHATHTDGQYFTVLKAGNVFSIGDLNAERSAVTKFLQDNGFYKFNKDFVSFVADTVPGKRVVDLTLTIFPYRANRVASEELHPFYRIAKVNYMVSGEDSKLPLRKSVLAENNLIEESEPYSASALQKTYQRFARLQALRFTNIRFDELDDSIARNALNCTILMSPNKPNSISFQPEGTNTAGDLGAAASVIYSNNNMFHGSEVFSLQLRGAYEAITELEGYNNSDYMEYGVEAKLQLPRFSAPFVTHTFKRNVLSTSELSVSFNSQNRPEFHRRVFSAAWRYKWSVPNKKTSYKLDVVDLNYIYMPWISEKFKHDYIDSVSNRNAILRYNYEDLFVMKFGFGLAYNNGTNAFKFNIESAGNLLNGLAKMCSFEKNAENRYTLFNIAYAQYVKGDVDATHMIKLSSRSELVLHGGLGMAYPYGNSDILPFEKRYFSGGPNSVRGWSVRGLGPGSYSQNDGRIDFINQTGDIKLDLNMEYRFFLFWKLYGAAFVDAGNIWTFRNYEEQPGGQFRIDKFYKQLAVAYGAGLRFNFGYFILRFDMGMKAVNPVYETSRQHYPIVSPKLSRDFAFHFAVGMPF